MAVPLWRRCYTYLVPNRDPIKEREYQRLYRIKNRVRILERKRKSRAERPDIFRAYNKTFRLRHPGYMGRYKSRYRSYHALRKRLLYHSDPVFRSKCLARSAVNNAIRAGKIAKGACEVCGTEKRVHAHHDDYAKPLLVRWLCAVHHKETHGGRFNSTPTIPNNIHSEKSD